ncbi:MAG: putative porin [Phycisphaerae bacterium]|nr:putative porin [Phycisphaerae bacterium]
MLKQAIVLGSITAIVMLSLTSVTAADDVSELQAQLQRLNARLEKMESQTTRQVEKDELAKMMKEILDDAKAAPALPEWMKDLKFSGDFRFRAEHQTFQGRRGGGAGGVAVRGEAKDRNRLRMRLRFGFTKTWWDKQMEVGFRLASGNNPDPTSTNQTMTGDFDKKPVWIDLMYAKYKPNWAKGLEIAGGKVKNPFRTHTMLTWDSDINPEGIYIDYQAPFFGDFKPYGQIGFWMVNENGARTPNTTVRDTEMLSMSLGFDWKIANAVNWFFGATYYKWYNADASNGGWLGRYGADGQWASGPGGNGPNNANNYPSADFGILELTTKVGWTMDFLPTPFQKWQTWFTYVRNCKDDYSTWKNPEIPALGGIGADRHFQSDPNAYGVGVQVGENKKKNDFSLAYSFFYIEANSVVPGFSDSDIRAGGTGGNNQGHVLQATYNIDDFLTLGGAMYLTQPIHTNDNPANRNVAFPHSQDMTGTFRVDLVWKF